MPTRDQIVPAAIESARQPPLVTDVLAHLDAKFGGIAIGVPRAAVAAEAAGRHRASLVAFCLADEHFEPIASPLDVFPLGRWGWLSRPSQRRQLERTLSRSDGFHVHGLWQEHAALSAAHARRWRKPYVVSPHGMVDAWAMRHRGMKKRIYTALIEGGNLAHATCLRALTDTELGDLRRLGLRNPVAVIPNGVDIPSTSPKDFLARFPELRGKRLVLYMGRIHHKKGPAMLCRAWARLHREFPDTHLMIAGPDFEGASAEIVQLIAEHDLARSVSMPGLLTAPLTWSALRAADLFVLPSYSEGLSRAILEAMGVGTPVLITHACNFPEAASRGAGVVIRTDEAELTATLSDLLRAPEAELRRMGENGARLVEERFSWDVVGGQLASLYDWVLGGGEPPSAFRVDTV